MQKKCSLCGMLLLLMSFCVLRCCRINSCVGQANHRGFLLTLCVFVLTAVYGISLVLRSLCPRQYLMTALFYCPGVYSQSRFETATFLKSCKNKKDYLQECL